MIAFYNEREPYAAAWLRNLIEAGHIAPGIVDERDIRDISPAELLGFRQCHFFAGIGVWSLALRRAGWPDDKPIWTGSCPCQPFSAAGQRGGVDDERHLWPHFHWLIDQCRPPVVVGEQVASKDGLGWLDLVSADLEGSGYAFGASDLCAAGFGGAHIRQRLYFVGLADPERDGRGSNESGRGSDRRTADGRSGESLRLADSESIGGGAGLCDIGSAGDRQRSSVDCDGGAICGLADSNGGNASAERQQSGGEHGWEPANGGNVRSGNSGPQFDARSELDRPHAPMLGRHPADWLYCRDGKWRPVEPGTFPLAHAATSRVGRLRAYGNALDAETAQGFVEAVMGAQGESK